MKALQDFFLRSSAGLMSLEVLSCLLSCLLVFCFFAFPLSCFLCCLLSFGFLLFCFPLGFVLPVWSATLPCFFGKGSLPRQLLPSRNAGLFAQMLCQGSLPRQLPTSGNARLFAQCFFQGSLPRQLPTSRNARLFQVALCFLWF